MAVQQQHVMCVTRFLVLLALIAPISMAYLPAAAEGEQTNQLDTIESQGKQKQIHATALRQQQQQQQQIRHHTSYDKNDDVVDDAPLDEGLTSLHWGHEQQQQQLQKVPEQHNSSASTLVSREEHQQQQQQQHYSHSTRRRQRRELSDWLIAPNTRWCGRGNTANGTYNHLGGASSADKCCRKHDHCQMYIPAMSNRFELFNYRPYTLSHCNCDRRFRTCLKMANDEDAHTIGKLFFNMVQTQCFIVRSEKVCQQRREEDGECLRQYTKQKAYLKNNKKF